MALDQWTDDSLVVVISQTYLKEYFKHDLLRNKIAELKTNTYYKLNLSIRTTGV